MCRARLYTTTGRGCASSPSTSTGTQMLNTLSAPSVGVQEAEVGVVGGAVVGPGAEVTRAAAEASRAEAGVAASLPSNFGLGDDTARVPPWGGHDRLEDAGCGISQAGGRLQMWGPWLQHGAGPALLICFQAVGCHALNI